MFDEYNIRLFRKQKGLSQEELGVKLNAVRQTISKWEQGLSVPDSAMLVSISKVLEIPANTLLGGNESEFKEDELKILTQNKTSTYSKTTVKMNKDKKNTDSFIDNIDNNFFDLITIQKPIFKLGL